MYKVLVENGLSKCGEGNYSKCHICSDLVIADGEDEALKHIIDPHHRELAESEAWIRLPKTPALQQVRSLTEEDYCQLFRQSISFKNNAYFCSLCCYDIDSFQFVQKHVQSEKHQESMKIDFEKILENDIYFKLKYYFCKLCRLRFNTIQLAFRHLLKEYHKKRLLRKREDKQEDELSDDTENESLNDQITMANTQEMNQSALINDKQIDKIILDENRLKNNSNMKLYCKLCKFNVSFNVVQGHITKPGHFNKLHSAKLEQNSYDLKKKESNSVLKDYFYCQVCDIWYTKDETLLRCHNMLHVHHQLPNFNFDIIKFDFNGDKLRITCLLCNREMGSDSELAHHVHSNRHLHLLQNNALAQNKIDQREVLTYMKLKPFFIAISEKKLVIKKEFIPEENYFVYRACSCKLPSAIDKKGRIFEFEQGQIDESHAASHTDNEYHNNLKKSFNCFLCFMCDQPISSMENLIKHYIDSPGHRRRYQNCWEIINGRANLAEPASSSGFAKKDATLVYRVSASDASTSKIETPTQKVVQNVTPAEPAKKTILVNPDNAKKVQNKTDLALSKSYVFTNTNREVEPFAQYYYCKRCAFYVPKDQPSFIQTHCMKHLYEEYPDLNNDVIQFAPNGKNLSINCLLCKVVIYRYKSLVKHLALKRHHNKMKLLLNKGYDNNRDLKIFPEAQPDVDGNQGFQPCVDLTLESFCTKCYVPDSSLADGFARELEFDPVPNHAHSREENALSEALPANANIGFYKCYLCSATCANRETLFEHYQKDPRHLSLIAQVAIKPKPVDTKQKRQEKNVEVVESESEEDDCNEEDEDEEAEENDEDRDNSEENSEGDEGDDARPKKAQSADAAAAKRSKQYAKEKRATGDQLLLHPYNEDVHSYGADLISMCLEPTSRDYIYHFDAQEIASMKRSLTVMYPIQSGSVYVCSACDYEVKLDPLHLFEHLRHDNHVENLNELLNSEPDDEGLSFLTLAENGLVERSESEIRCDVCCINIDNTSESLTRHLSSPGSKHRTNLQLSKNKMEQLGKEYFDLLADFWYLCQHFYCQLCKTELKSELNFVRHLKRDEHLNRVKLLENAGNGYAIDKCLTCLSCWYGPVKPYSEHCLQDYFHNLPANRRGCQQPKLDKKSSQRLKELSNPAALAPILLRESDKFSRKDMYRESQLLEDIEHTVRPLYPKARAYVFGSRSACLSMCNSDMDVFVDLDNVYHDKGLKQASQRYIKRVVRPFFQDNVRIWRREKVLLTPRVPIIKLQHKPTGIKCDLSFMNGLGVEKSNLIRKYVLAYENCRALILYLKKWFNAVKLYGPRAINAYAITWFTIFYLQTLDILPSVHQIQQSAPSNIVDGWECGSPKTIIAGRSSSHYNFRELLNGFFSFYAKFDYQTSVVCPLLGRVAKKSEFVSVDSMPKEMKIYKNRLRTEDLERLRYDSAMCIQDPVDLSQNITKGVKKKQLLIFRNYCKTF